MEFAARKMTPTQIAEAERLARKRKPPSVVMPFAPLNGLAPPSGHGHIQSEFDAAELAQLVRIGANLNAPVRN
jgi:hypothetical protein